MFVLTTRRIFVVKRNTRKNAKRNFVARNLVDLDVTAMRNEKCPQLGARGIVVVVRGRSTIPCTTTCPATQEAVGDA
jgi:hypothetical protein